LAQNGLHPMQALTDSLAVDSLQEVINQNQLLIDSLKKSKDLKSLQLVLDYLKVLIWPAVALFVLIRYHKYIKSLLERVVTDTEEIKSSFLGLSAKLRGITDMANSETLPIEAKEEIQGKLHRVFLEEFSEIATIFFTGSHADRRRAAIEIAKLSANIPLHELLQFATSTAPGERVSAFIGIKEKIRAQNPEEPFSEELKQVLMNALNDPLSRVRYRVVNAIGINLTLAKDLQKYLEEGLEDENNQPTIDEYTNVLNKLSRRDKV